MDGKVMPRSLPKSLMSWLIPKLRRHSLIWPGKAIARDEARVEVEDGKFKNGNSKFKVMYECAECKRQGIKKYHEKHLTQMDHIKPAMDIAGFTTWDDFLNRLFCKPDNYQCLCLDHHEEKTGKENIKRRFNKQKQDKKLTKSNKSTFNARKKVNKRLTSKRK
jgi:hypothetical protein